MIPFIISAVKIVVLLGFLIFIHELGHFTVAKLCKVKVNEFAIGFGPAIWKKQGKETKYAIRLIPLGGYVSMEGEEERSEDDRSFSKASIPKRIAIVVAGATVNIIFALGLYFVLTLNQGTYITNQVDYLMDGYVSQEVGIQPNDKIVRVNGKNISTKEDIDNIMKIQNGEELEIELQRDKENLKYKLKPTEVKIKVTGIYLDDECKIAAVEKNSASEKQGIKANDIIVKINNVDINNNVNKAVQIINEQSEKVKLTLKRGKELIDVELIPDTESRYYLGIRFKEAEDNFINRCINGAIETKKFAFSIIDNLKQLFTGKIGVDQMSGPVGISNIVAKTNGIYEFLNIMALISLSLGVTNLLPIPALDGGKILILIIEAIRRKPLKQELEIKIQLLGFSLLIALAIYVTYNDILRII